MGLNCKSPPTGEERDEFKKQISRERPEGEKQGRGDGIKGGRGIRRDRDEHRKSPKIDTHFASVNFLVP